MLREIGALTVAIRRPEVEPTKFERALSHLRLPRIAAGFLHLLFGIHRLHVSETEWFKIRLDIAISNTGTLCDLTGAVDSLVEGPP
jgi:hypothetical protein